MTTEPPGKGWRPMPVDQPDLTPAERSLRAKRAADARWAKPGARQRQAEATTAAGLARHERIVDPDGRAEELREASASRRLTSPERAELNDITARTWNSLQAELAGMALKASKAARKAAEALKAADDARKASGARKSPAK